MLWFIIAGIVAIAALVLFLAANDGILFAIGKFILMAISLFFIASIFNGVFDGVGCSDEVYVAEEVKILALSDNSRISGSGFIFLSVDEKNVYTYMKENNDGTYEMEEMNSDNIKIKESDMERPSIKTYYKKRESNLWSVFEPLSYTLITVPTGSISHIYNVDLE